VTHCSLQQRVKRVRAENYVQGRRRMEAWRSIVAFALSKGVQPGRRCITARHQNREPGSCAVWLS